MPFQRQAPAWLLLGGLPMRPYFFPMVVGICVITGLIIVDVSQHISPGTQTVP
jgi:hypothetical protein